MQLSQMNRRMAVRKRKNVVANGHAFQPLRFYQLIKCTVCGEFMLTVVGYQCQSKREAVHRVGGRRRRSRLELPPRARMAPDCGCACHRRCCNDVKSKCTHPPPLLSPGEAAMAATSTPSSPVTEAATPGHRFETVAVNTPMFCAHCGTMLPIGKKKTQKCQGRCFAAARAACRR